MKKDKTKKTTRISNTLPYYLRSVLSDRYASLLSLIEIDAVRTLKETCGEMGKKLVKDCRIRIKFEVSIIQN